MKKIVLMALAVLIAASSLAMAQNQNGYDNCRAKKDPECASGADHCCAGKYL